MIIRLSLHLPDLRRVWCESRAASEIMLGSGDELISHSAACIKVSGVRLVGCIYCNKYSFVLKSSLEDALVICEYN